MLLYHDSHNSLYRAPFGAQPKGENITLRLKVSDDPDKVTVRVWYEGNERFLSMVKRGPLYEASFDLPDMTCLVWYYFIAEKGNERLYLGNTPDMNGGEGAVSISEPPSYQITVYDPVYRTPGWMRESIFYQILPDRFFCSRPLSKRKKPKNGHLHKQWDEYPESYTGKDDTRYPADDFFGGDLKGIEKKLPYLKEMGISAIYLNPIFMSPSNHKYDTGDYMQVDPSFGSEQDFKDLCESAKNVGIRIMLDGVFSHRSRQPLFQQVRKLQQCRRMAVSQISLFKLVYIQAVPGRL